MVEMIDYIDVEEKVLTIRGQQVLIDRDVAELYGVETKDINRAVKNNPDKFLDGYVVALRIEDKSELVKKFHRFESLKHSTAQPTAFTEKGLYMLATILKSKRATQTTIAIVETFAKIREMSRAISQLPDVLEKDQQIGLIKKTSAIIGEVLDDHLMIVSGDELTLELDMGVLKITRKIKREKRTLP